MGGAEDPETGLLGRWGPGLGSGETLNKLERALGPGKVELASCEGVPTGARRILEGRKAVDERRGSWGARHPDPVGEGQGQRQHRARPSWVGERGPGLGLGVRSLANPGGGQLSDAGGLEGKGLKNTPEKGGAPATQGRGLPGEKRPERKRSAEGQERGPARGAPPGVGLG